MGDLRPRLGIVCGMISEVRALGAFARDPRVAVAVSGARPEKAGAEARRLAGAGCTMLMSWGLAGGLDPALKPGDILAPAAVIDETGFRWAVNEGFSGQRENRAGAQAALLGVDRIVLTAGEKAALHARIGAVALDMESHLLARAAAEHGLPALVVRAIADPAARALPELALRALGADGRPRFGAVLGALVRRPGDLGAMLALRRDSRVALAALGGWAERHLAQVL